MDKYLFSNEKKIQPHLTSLDASKKLSAKIASTKSAKSSQNACEIMLEKWWCDILSGRKKTDKVKLWRSICLVMKIFRTVSSDVVWPFKNRFCQNRINKISQIQPKCLRNYAWKMMMWHIVWSKKTGKAKLWRSICLVMKIFRTVSSDVVWPFKNRFCQNRINKIGQIQPKCLRIMWNENKHQNVKQNNQQNLSVIWVS